jgi:hypothetical protein
LFLCSILLLFFSCSQEVEELQIERNSFERERLISDSDRGSKTTDSDEFILDRLRINSDYSLIVKRFYKLNTLQKITYLLDYQQPNDKIQVLDLRDINHDSGSYYLFALNSKVNNIDAGLLFHDNMSVDGGGGVEYDCDCNSLEVDKVDDCVVRRYRNLVYCDGNFCTACSVVVQIEEAEKQNIPTKNSVILLPSNFKI